MSTFSPSRSISHAAFFLFEHQSNFGKLNYFLGKRAADEGRESRYPNIDFCRDPEAICSSKEHEELKWIGKKLFDAAGQESAAVAYGRMSKKCVSWLTVLILQNLPQLDFSTG